MTAPNTATVAGATTTPPAPPTVRDLVTMGGAAVVLIGAFLPFYATDYYSVTTWHWGGVATLLLGFGAGTAAGVLVAVARFTPAGDVGPKVGLAADRLPAVLAVVSFAELFLSAVPASVHGVGQWIGLLGAAALLVGTVLAPFVPALATPLGGGAVAPTTFWFSVAVPTPVHDPGTGAPRATLQPGRWYLAVADHGTAWLVSDAEFGQAVLHDLRSVHRA